MWARKRYYIERGVVEVAGVAPAKSGRPVRLGRPGVASPRP